MRKRFIMGIFVGVLVVMVVAPLLLRGVVALRYTARIVEADAAALTGYDTAVVFGAAVRRGQPSTVLRDRLDTAIALYHSGQVSQLIMSGDGRAADYDEPGVMAQYAIQRGIPRSAILLDRAGLRTYATCHRLRDVYETSTAVLVTQAYHLPRALFTCELLGIDAVGVSADKRAYHNAHWYNFREYAALTAAAWDVIVRPLFGGERQP